MQEQMQESPEKGIVVIDGASKAENAIRELVEKMAMASGSANISREPAADVIEEPDRVIVLLDVPGVPKDRLRIAVGSNYVEVKASPALIPQANPQAKLIHLERVSNYKLQRRIEFPFRIKIDEAKAYLKDGVLQITVPKAEDNKTETELVVE